MYLYLIEKLVRNQHGHAAVMQSEPQLSHWETGKARLARKQSQKNCLDFSTVIQRVTGTGSMK